MNTKAFWAARWVAVLFLLAVPVIAGVWEPAPPPPLRGVFEPLVPWQGIRNSIFGPNVNEVYDSPPPCGGVVDFDVGEALRLGALGATKVTKGRSLKDGESAEAIWKRRLEIKQSASISNKAVVRRTGPGKGEVGSGGNWKAARVGDRLGDGFSARTGSGSTLDLFLGENGPVVRLTENSEVEIVRLWLDDRGAVRVIDTMIDVRQGRILGNVKKLAPESSYMVKTHGGVVRIRGTEFSISEDGTCIIVVGEAEVITASEVFSVKSGEVYELVAAKVGKE